MREILFRAKRKDNGKWVYGNYCYVQKFDKSGYEYILIEISEDGSSYEIIPETVGQFTGLMDKNGKKIFEGDIVKFFWFDTDNITTIGDIRYSETGCSFLWYEQGEFPCGFDNTTKMEVIGDIHDNPELLGE